MRARHDPWRWPVACGAAALLLVGLLLVPESWFDAFFSPLTLRTLDRGPGDLPVLRILPVPRIEVASPAQDEEESAGRPPSDLADWWDEAWEARLRVEVAPFFSPQPRDSAIVTTMRPLGDPLTATLFAAPDSALARRLALLRVEDALGFEHLKSWLLGRARAGRYESILNQAAYLYDEFLGQQVEVTDLPDRP